MADTFGPTDAPTPAKEAEMAPAPPPAPPKRPRRIIVDELRDTTVSVGYSTVIFRPGQHLTGHLIELAREHGIATREV